MTEVIDPKYDISREGRELVKNYQYAVDRTKTLKSQWSQAINDEAEARKALIKWCSPRDAKPGEKFGIWSRDQYGNEVLIEAQVEYITETEGDAPSVVHEGTINLRYRK